MGELHRDQWGGIYRELPDGRRVVVRPMTYGKGRIYLERGLSIEGGW